MSIEEIINHLDVLACVGEEAEENGRVRDVNGANAAALREAIALLKTYYAHMEILKEYSEATDGIGLKRLRELNQAEKSGLLVVLPCKVGDTVYRVFSVRDREPVVVPCEIKTVGQAADLVGRIGKKGWMVSTYLTREEAEEALRKEEKKEMKNFIGPYPWSRISVDPCDNQFVLIPTVGIVFTRFWFRFRIAFMFLNFRASIGFFRRPGRGGDHA